MNKENKLGMGLEVLLSNTNNNPENSNGIHKINISQITPNPSQPRKSFKDEDLKELSSSIKNQGLIQPIIIKPIKDDQYQIIAGERRWRACQLNGMHEVECVIKNLDDTNVLRIAPFSELGTPLQLVKKFGGKDEFEKAVQELQAELYREAG